MKKNRKNYKIEYLRALSFIAVLLYHLNILKGGYLAVYCFFVLSGYLSILSLSKHRKQGVLRFYANRLIKTYLPMAVCVLLAIAALAVFSISYPNLKAESTSVLLGYNNFWQIAASQDYFTRTNVSPFLPMWYLAILLQYDLLLGIFFFLTDRFLKKENRIVSYILCLLLAAGSFILFMIRLKNGEIMKAYYGTLERSFSFLMGILLGLLHEDDHILITKNRNLEKGLFYFDLIVLALLFVFAGSDAKMMAWFMLSTSILSMRIIDHSSALKNTRDTADYYVAAFSRYSYEIYLLQYPIYYLLLNSGLSSFFIKLFTMILTFVFAVLVHNALDMRKIFKKRIFNLVLCTLVTLTSLFGAYRFIVEKDHGKEMEELKEKLSENEKLIEEKNKEYLSKLNSEEEAYQALLESSGNKEEDVKQMLLKTPVVGIGDSLLVNAVDTLYEMFPIGYFDGKISRDLYAGEEILQSMKEEGTLSDTIVLCLSTNGDYIESRNEKLMEIVEGRQVFWIDAVGADDSQFNKRFEEFAKNYNNLHIIHWEEASRGHPDWFWSDGIHIIEDGVDAFCGLIYDSIYSYYLDQYEAMFEEAKARSEAQKDKRIAFYGDDVLIDAYDHLSKVFDQALYNTKNDYDPDALYEDLKKRSEEGRLEKTLIFLFEDMRKGDYEKIVTMCEGHRIIIVDLNGSLYINDTDVEIIDFAKVCKENKDYLGLEKGKLSAAAGYEALGQILKQKLS